MRVVVNVAGRGAWLWTFPGDEAGLRRAWADGRAPLEALDGVARAYDGALDRVLRTPGDLDAIVDIDEGEAILYVGDDALRWSARGDDAAPAAAPADDGEPTTLVAVYAADRAWTWTFPGTLDELEVELDEGRFPGHLAPSWRGGDARFLGRLAPGGAQADARITLTGPGKATFELGGARRAWSGLVERAEAEAAPTLVQLVARAPFRARVVKDAVVELVARPDSDLEALRVLLAHPESEALVHVDVRELRASPRAVVAAVLSRPRPALDALHAPELTDAEVDALRAAAPALRELGQPATAAGLANAARLGLPLLADARPELVEAFVLVLSAAAGPVHLVGAVHADDLLRLLAAAPSLTWELTNPAPIRVPPARARGLTATWTAELRDILVDLLGLAGLDPVPVRDAATIDALAAAVALARRALGRAPPARTTARTVATVLDRARRALDPAPDASSPVAIAEASGDALGLARGVRRCWRADGPVGPVWDETLGVG